jgi:hypothetical protein
VKCHVIFFFPELFLSTQQRSKGSRACCSSGSSLIPRALEFFFDFSSDFITGISQGAKIKNVRNIRFVPSAICSVVITTRILQIGGCGFFEVLAAGAITPPAPAPASSWA